MKRLAATVILFLSPFAVSHAQDDARPQSTALPHYKVLGSSTNKNALEQWTVAADQGYRLLFEGKLAVMRLVASPPDTYRYAPLPDRNLRTTFLNALNQQGAFGYAWIENTHMLEKLPHPHVYEYSIVEGFAAGTRHASHDSLLAQGYHAVGRFGSIPVYMRDTTLAAPPDTAAARFVRSTTPRAAFKQVSALGAQGFRYVSFELTDSGTAMRMEPCDAACGGPFQYRQFEVRNAAQLQKTLNVLAADGFKVVHSSFEGPLHVVERGAVTPATPRCSYRVAEAQDAAALEQSLNSAEEDGFVPLGFVYHTGWTVDPYLILEKAPASAPR